MRKDTRIVKVPGAPAWTAILNGQRIAEFNSEGAARAGIEVERRRREKRKSKP